MVLRKKRIKTLWQARKLWRFLCPLCGTERRLPWRPQPGGVRHAAQVGLSAAMLAFLFWPLMRWKGLFFFVPLWTLFEIIYRMRMRVFMRCDKCAFDTFLYITDKEKALGEVKKHFHALYVSQGLVDKVEE